MYCQFEQIKERNVVVRCFNQALYHVSSAEIQSHNYCAFHISKLPRKTKLDLLFDVIELPPSEITVDCQSPHNKTLVANENDIKLASAGLVTSNSASSDVHLMNGTDYDTQASHGEARVCKSSFKRPFDNLGQLCECYGYLPRPKTWRMLPYAIPGEINGLPGSRGMAIATNGVHVAIENSACIELFFGHLDFFIIDDLRAPAGALNTLNQAAENSFKVVKNNLKQFDELFL